MHQEGISGAKGQCKAKNSKQNEDYKFDGKDVIPFNTHEGSGDAGTYDKIQSKLPSAKVNNKGLALDGKTARSDDGKQQTVQWLKGLGY